MEEIPKGKEVVGSIPPISIFIMFERLRPECAVVMEWSRVYNSADGKTLVTGAGEAIEASLAMQLPKCLTNSVGSR
jgi:hypothetical protein